VGGATGAGAVATEPIAGFSGWLDRLGAWLRSLFGGGVR
jgi:hypothetical protein